MRIAYLMYAIVVGSKSYSLLTITVKTVEEKTKTLKSCKEGLEMVIDYGGTGCALRLLGHGLFSWLLKLWSFRHLSSGSLLRVFWGIWAKPSLLLHLQLFGLVLFRFNVLQSERVEVKNVFLPWSGVGGGVDLRGQSNRSRGQTVGRRFSTRTVGGRIWWNWKKKITKG